MNAPLIVSTAENMGLDLLKAMLTEIKLLKKPWEKLSQNQQDELIERLRKRITENVAQAVHLLAADGRVVVGGDLDQVTIKDGVKAVVKFSAAAPNLHELYEVAGKAVLLVVADVPKFTGGMDQVKGESDQRGMDLGNEYDQKGDGKGMDDSPGEGDIVTEVREIPALEAPTPAHDGDAEDDPVYDKAVECVIAEQKATISFVQQRLSIGYNRAAALIERMEAEGIVGKLEGDGTRAIFGRQGGKGGARPPIDAD